MLITGGTGQLGRELIPRCRDRGWTVRIMSRGQAPPNPGGVEWATADLATGAGLDAAVDGVQAVVHLASLPYRGRRTDHVDIEGTSRLVDAAARAGVSHLVYSSIVGVDAIRWPYFRKKLAAEDRVRHGPVPWSIVRATQFYPLIDSFLAAAARLPILFVPADVLGRPVDPRDVAERLAQQLARGPSTRIENYAGPEILRFDAMADQWLAAREVCKRVRRVPIPGHLGRAFRAGKAVPPDGERGERTWRSWLEEHPPPTRGYGASGGKPAARELGQRIVSRWLPVQNRVVNPLVGALVERGLGPPTFALLETVGRRTGRRRRVVVANGLQGDTFWLIAGLGDRAAYVRNLRANPRVRVIARPAWIRDGVRLQSRTGTAHPLPDDDTRARHRQLGVGRPGYRLDGILLRTLAAGRPMLTIRIDLD